MSTHPHPDTGPTYVGHVQQNHFSITFSGFRVRSGVFGPLKSDHDHMPGVWMVEVAQE